MMQQENLGYGSLRPLSILFIQKLLRESCEPAKLGYEPNLKPEGEQLKGEKSRTCSSGG